jgi:hypothetical protein
MRIAVSITFLYLHDLVGDLIEELTVMRHYYDWNCLSL